MVVFSSQPIIIAKNNNRCTKKKSMIGFRISLFKILFTITFLLFNIHLSAQVK